MNNAIKLGSISTSLNGDHSYTDRLEVIYRQGDCVEIVVKSSVPRGGMDGDPTPLWTERSECRLHHDVLAKDLLKALKDVLNRESYNFKRYGKPTKNFNWISEESKFGVYGLKLEHVKSALYIARYNPEG